MGGRLRAVAREEKGHARSDEDGDVLALLAEASNGYPQQKRRDATI